jgi:hypothetical protein
MTNVQDEDRDEAMRMAASMATTVYSLKQKLKDFKQPMASTKRHSLLADLAELRGYADVISTLVVCARRQEG